MVSIQQLLKYSLSSRLIPRRDRMNVVTFDDIYDQEKDV